MFLFNYHSLLLHVPWKQPARIPLFLAVCFHRRLYPSILFLWYIRWKPGHKFRSRIKMNGSAVCTCDTTPRTKVRAKGCSTRVWIYSLIPIQSTIHPTYMHSCSFFISVIFNPFYCLDHLLIIHFIVRAYYNSNIFRVWIDIGDDSRQAQRGVLYGIKVISHTQLL